MCDISCNAIGEQCCNGSRFLCSNSNCPNAIKLPGEAEATMTRLCDMHASFCRHCAHPFCRTCIAAHQDTCSMKPTPETAWERFQRVQNADETT